MATLTSGTFGFLSPKQEDVLRDHVRGKCVHDYGCGNLTLSARLLELGADKVFGVDRDPQSVPSTLRDRLFFHRGHFDHYRDVSDVAFTAWPANWNTGLHPLLEQSPKVIYLGKNTDSSACGYSEMWRGLMRREVLAHVPEKQNTLIVYGPALVTRDPLPEERAALDFTRVWSFEDLHERAAQPLSKTIYEHCLDGLSYARLPRTYRDSLQRYVEYGLMPGNALKLALENDLKALMSFRDNPKELLDIVFWLHNEAPALVWGSPEKVQAWARAAGEFSK